MKLYYQHLMQQSMRSFENEYPPGSGALENDPKMQATYDAILEDK